MSVAGIILAAGASTRLGRPKQTVSLGEETLLERAVRVAMEAGLSPVAAVIAAPALESTLLQAGTIPLHNPSAGEGVASSIRTGISWAEATGACGVVLMTCDQVGLSPEHLRRLAAGLEEVRGSFYSGRVGVPAYFPRSSFAELVRLRGDRGARDLLRTAASIADESLALDVDTEADVQTARMFLESSRPPRD